MRYAIYEGSGGCRFVAGDRLGPIIARISKASGCRVTTVARARGAAGYGPANSESTSTHCGFNDGTAYPKLPARFPLRWWMWGMDLEIPDIPRFIREARKEGMIVTLTYPHSRGEAQHCNFRKEPPSWTLYMSRPLKKGSKGPRVAAVTKALCRIPDAHGAPYLSEPSSTMTDRVVQAVRAFQRDHHQVADGVVGVATRRQVSRSDAYHRRKKGRRR
jgi:hypothetical protein